MRVAFNARLLRDPNLRGWNRYTVNLLAELSRAGVDLLLYSDQPVHENHLDRLWAGTYRTVVSTQMRYFLWEQLWLPHRCAVDGVDVLHSPFNFGLPWSGPCPKVLTLHDAIDRAYYRRVAGWRKRYAFRAMRGQISSWIARTRGDHIITVSEHSKSGLIRYLGLAPSKITVIHEAADARFQMPVSGEARLRVRNRYALPERYFFYVGGWERRKNVPFLVRAFAEAQSGSTGLVLAGGTEKETSALRALIESLELSDLVRLLGWVDDARILQALYAEATCFVYPSEYEGFGLQLCEAMAVGCPTLAARASSLPEVLGHGGETFDLQNVNELVNLLGHVVKDDSYREHLANKARVRSEAFAWSRTARETLEVYASLIERDARARKQHRTLIE